MAKEKQIFVEFLKRKSLKLTNQREKILECFLTTAKHLSVDDLYGLVKRKYADVGHATVFRTVKLLCEADIAKEVDLGDKYIRYEHKYGHQRHIHLICAECGKLIETVAPEMERLQSSLCKRLGFFPRRRKMEIIGICKRCKEKVR